MYLEFLFHRRSRKIVTIDLNTGRKSQRKSKASRAYFTDDGPVYQIGNKIYGRKEILKNVKRLDSIVKSEGIILSYIDSGNLYFINEDKYVKIFSKDKWKWVIEKRSSNKILILRDDDIPIEYDYITGSCIIGDKLDQIFPFEYQYIVRRGNKVVDEDNTLIIENVKRIIGTYKNNIIIQTNDGYVHWWRLSEGIDEYDNEYHQWHDRTCGKFKLAKYCWFDGEFNISYFGF